MGHVLPLARSLPAALAVVGALACGSDEHHASPDIDAGKGGAGATPVGASGATSSGGTSAAGGAAGSASGGRSAKGRDAGTAGTPGSGADASAGDAAPPVTGAPGCGFATAAFCDTFDGRAAFRGRGGDLDARFWSAGRMAGQLSTMRAMGIGMAVIPSCRPGVSNHVWPDDDTLVCNPSADVASNHLLVAVAAQNYGQNGYRIRQPFDFAGRTGKVVFDATVEPLGPLHGWVSFAVTEDPITMPGY